MSHFKHTCLAVLLSSVVVMLLGLAPVRADELSPQDKKAALKHYQRGAEHHERGEYDQAIAEYTQSYQLSRAPKLLFNVAQAYRLKGEHERSIEHYERYLTLEPTDPLADVARVQIDQLREELAGVEARRKAEEARRHEQARKAEETRRREMEEARRREQQRHLEEERRRQEAAAAAEAGRTSARRWRTAGIVSAGVGLAGIAGGAYMGLQARNIASEVEQASEWDSGHQQRYEEGQRANRNMLILTSLAATAAIAGSAMYYLGYERGGDISKEHSTRQPMLGIWPGGISASMRF